MAVSRSFSATLIGKVGHRDVNGFPVKRARLGFSIGFHGTVVIEVVTGKIGTHAGHNSEAIDPAMIQAAVAPLLADSSIPMGTLKTPLTSVD